MTVSSSHLLRFKRGSTRRQTKLGDEDDVHDDENEEEEEEEEEDDDDDVKEAAWKHTGGVSHARRNANRSTWESAGIILQGSRH